MTGPQATVTFGDVVGIEECRFTLLRGVQPSRGVLVTPIINQTLTSGTIADLVIAYNGSTLTLADCIVVESHVETGPGGQTLQIIVEDRRWRWKYSEAFGRYNVRKESDAILEQIKYEKTPQELATILFGAMGESGYDVTALPNDARPFVEWRNARADLELGALLQDLGCDVAPDLSDGTFKVVKVGTGANLPADGTIEHASWSVTAAATPDVIRAVSEATRYQVTLILEPVGVDTDSKVKHVDDLSYMPANGGAGWSIEDPDFFDGVTGTYTDPESGETRKKRDLALSTVWRMYRVKHVVSDADDELLQPQAFADAVADGVPALTNINQLLPLLPTLNSTYVDPEDDLEKPRRPYVFASWYDSDFGEETDGLPQDLVGNIYGARWPYGFNVDLERGIVNFGQPVYLIDDTTWLVAPAEIWLTAVVAADWLNLNQKVYYGLSRVKSGVVTPTMPLVVQVPDVALKYWEKMDGTITSNQTEVDAELDHYLDALEDTLVDREGGTGTYADLLTVSPDGAIEQIEWVVNSQGMTTRIARFTQLAGYVPSYKDLQRSARREREALRASQAPLVVQTRIGPITVL